jgi:hypothetical protein
MMREKRNKKDKNLKIQINVTHRFNDVFTVNNENATKKKTISL